jgi:hypothetical protein
VVEWVVVIGEPGPQEQQVVLGAPNQETLRLADG